MRIQFILKKNTNYNFISYCRRSSGLWNSTRFIVEGLGPRGVHAEIVEVEDNNQIDREVRRFKPDICVIEALWVVPEKFPVLQRLHPKTQFFVHMHSGLPFLALEGIAMDWLCRYPSVGVGVIANSPETFDAFKMILPDSAVSFLPNVYLPDFRPCIEFKDEEVIDVACLGAVRPMKNQLAQAVAAIHFANEQGKRLKFYVNSSRVEVGGSPVLKNLRQLFDQQAPHKLIQMHWMEHEEMLDFLHRRIDIGVQVSMTETFNVVTADYVTAGVPCVVSKEIKWASTFNRAEDDSVKDMVRIMRRVWHSRFLVNWNQRLLQEYSNNAQQMWYEWVRRHVGFGWGC